MDDDDTLLEVALSLGSEALSATTVRFVEATPQPAFKGTTIFMLYAFCLFDRVFRFMTNTILYKILLNPSLSSSLSPFFFSRFLFH